MNMNNIREIYVTANKSKRKNVRVILIPSVYSIPIGHALLVTFCHGMSCYNSAANYSLFFQLFN